jgi:hypothetical protein
MQNAEANDRSTDVTVKAPDRIDNSHLNVPKLYESMSDLARFATAVPAGFPPAAALLPPESLRVGPNELPPNSGGRNVPPLGSGGGGDNGFGHAPADARGIDYNKLLPDLRVGNVPRLGSGGGDKDFSPELQLTGTPDRKELPPGLKVENIPGPGSRAPGAKIDALPDKVPGTDAGDLNRERKAEKVGDEAEQRLAANARHAANILNDKGDLGNEYQRNQIKEMYKKALEEGGHQAVEKLTQAINKELEKRGSNVRISSDMEFPALVQLGDGIRLRVMKGPHQVDEARISRTSPWERRGVLDSF